MIEINKKGKKPKKIQHYEFNNISKRDMVNIANENLPINLKHLSKIIDKIHDKYPLVTKTDLTYVVKAIIYSLREFLILGYIINLNNFFHDYKLHFNKFIKNNIIYYGVKAKIKTSPALKK